MSKYYPPAHKAKTVSESPPSMSSKEASSVPTSHVQEKFQSCDLVRFVLRSGASLELTYESIEDVVESVAGRVCNAVCGCTVEGKHVSVEWDRVDYIMEG